MAALRLHSALTLLLLLGACSSTSRPASTPTGAPQMEGRDADDVIRLTNGETVRGRILEETGRQIVMERENAVSSYPRAAIFSIDYSKERWQERRQPLQTTETPSSAARPSTTWLPRTDPREPVQQTEVLFYDTHALVDCVGAPLAKAHQELPDFRLFVEPGGKILLQDPKQWGYHAHLPGGALRIPVGKPGLSIELSKDEASIPESVAFVSPAQEIKAGDGDARSSYALPDAVTAEIRLMPTADAMLASQPFAGGKPAATPNGTMWAFTLPRNSRQFFVYLLDQHRKHGEILKSSYVGFGDTILAADLMIDVVGADGVMIGRVLTVPFPDNVSADGPAREPLTVYAGPVKDPTAVVTLSLPPREAIQLPPKAASLKADVLVSHYDVSNAVPQSLVLAHGVGRPTKDVTIVSRELTTKDPDEIVKIDVSSLPEERFPAVVWLYQRRTFVWKTTGGYLAPVFTAALPPRGDALLSKVKRSEAIPHVIPMLFLGPKPASVSSRGADPAAGIAGGMANGLLRDALMRESGGLSPLTQPMSPGAGGGDGAGAVSNVTNVYITAPQHTPTADLGGLMGGSSGAASNPFGMHYQTQGGPAAMFAPGAISNGVGGVAMRPAGTLDTLTGVVRDRNGAVTYDPRTGAVGSGNNGAITDPNGVAIDPDTGAVIGVTHPIRRKLR